MTYFVISTSWGVPGSRCFWGDASQGQLGKKKMKQTEGLNRSQILGFEVVAERPF
ncbi:hypothetical protein Hneap_0931 [Halothiobacillus neapolitanus c2]|uniref:Uncharacterized protein n=1 Tax=Halothiobacillus neapolitanus (strain ATCC 23641 / DSM 15147 / CIP 104769 / NCIMB 8539 / c2) TaxID=555778 RepID=D0KZA0_HALNC|nr:hypothetical protein Hneap_0931 [Halothiobacillus neapolitanus c2]TDN66080.1 hypothetical protein C8D83_101401 [Halothiobacillus neapolitanus]